MLENNYGYIWQLAMDMFFVGKEHHTRALIAKQNNDYFAYSQEKHDFEDILQMMKNPIFSDYSYVQRLENLQFPEFTVQDWIDTADNLQEIMCTDGSSIAVDDDNDVPF